jgi:hypothetical protein
VLVLSGYALGLFLTAEVGPVTLIVRSVLRGGRAVAVGLAMAAAVATIDLAYAIVGLPGGSTGARGELDRGSHGRARRRRARDAYLVRRRFDRGRARPKASRGSLARIG